jgi:hypothetical protein
MREKVRDTRIELTCELARCVSWMMKGVQFMEEMR